MIKRHYFQLISGLIVFAVIFAACNDYNKVLKSGDADLKYRAAMEYYENGRYDRAIPLLEELLSLYRGTGKSEQIYFYYAYSNFYEGNYILSAYYFENFVKTYPNSTYAEEALFMAGYSDYKSSPVYSLDQQDTYKAIDNLQIFMNTFPNSSLLDSCNALISELRYKLEKKAFENAYLYYKLGNYDAALISFKYVLQDFPESNFKEDVLFWMLASHYEIAVKSIKSKQKERFEETVNAYYKFIDTFPDSKKAQSAEKYFKNALKHLESLNS